MNLYVVLHNPPETGRTKVIGIYSSVDLAEAAIERAKVLPGFIDRPDAFTIDRYDVDMDHWSRGFVSL